MNLPPGGLYQGYAYAYPHKSAYRAFEAPMPLTDIWAGEALDRAFLYLHVPFCEMRCGFCNLFTMANPDEDLTTRFLAALTRQTEAIQAALPGLRPARMALGGGTPTWLTPDQLDYVFDLFAARLRALPSEAETSVETSPKTATSERLAVLRERGVQRISIGAQSFEEGEARAMGRPQKTVDLEAALDRIRQAAFARLNIDLIYGAAGQTPASWLQSIRRALAWRPEELFLYPLYVRPLTGLDGKGGPVSTEGWDRHRLTLYRAGRDLLLSEGYVQTSMRRFARPAVAGSGEVYCCQDDAMVGLGPGARSYARSVHYSSRYAVKRAGVAAIIERYCGQQDFSRPDYGVILGEDEQMRRFILQSVFHLDGLDVERFVARFGRSPLEAAPALQDFLRGGFLREVNGRLEPTASGFEHSDALAPLLYSPAVASEMRGFELQ